MNLLGNKSRYIRRPVPVHETVSLQENTSDLTDISDQTATLFPYTWRMENLNSLTL